ncbi:hypothetical protein HK097_005941 [Rhizophlyctis rosea]|uniref:RING-type domain-containing protein n=1 Tax=Rhizophlyctis rosea TaxID=64517 RepID=A0AAD5SD48_9FUNG|nr:hypothetical protein HK097_005941 [Rhizophlyctis rosea]
MPGTLDSSPFPPQRQTLRNGVLVPKRPTPAPPEQSSSTALPHEQSHLINAAQIPTYLPSPSTTPPPLQHRPFSEPRYSTAPDIRPRTASRHVLPENYSYLHPFESDKSPFSRQLKCVKCHHVFDTPLILPCCGGRICMSCVKGNKGFDKSGQLCSLCMTAVSMSDLLVDEELKRTVDDLHVFCARKRKGCEWVGPRKYLFVHVAEECIFAPGNAQIGDFSSHYQKTECLNRMTPSAVIHSPNPETMNYLSAVEDPTRSVSINATFPFVSETLGRPVPPRVDSTPKLGTDISVGLWTEDFERPLNTEHRFRGHILIPPRCASAEPIVKKSRGQVLDGGVEVPRRTAVPRVGEGGDLTLSDADALAMSRRAGTNTRGPTMDEPIEVVSEVQKWQLHPSRLDEEEAAFAMGMSTPRSQTSQGYGVPHRRWSGSTKVEGTVASHDGISLMGDASMYSGDSDALTEVDDEEWRGTINGWRARPREEVVEP